MKYTCIPLPGGLNSGRCNILLLRAYCCRQTSVAGCSLYRILVHIQMGFMASVNIAEPVSNLLCSFLRESIKTQWTLTILHYPLPNADPSLWCEEGKERRAKFRPTERAKWINKIVLLISGPIVLMQWLSSCICIFLFCTSVLYTLFLLFPLSISPLRFSNDESSCPIFSAAQASKNGSCSDSDNVCVCVHVFLCLLHFT